MGKLARIGLIAGAMAVAVTGRGCVTAPPQVALAAGASTPVVESVVAGSPKPSAQTSRSLAGGDAVAPDVPAPAATNTPISTATAPQDATAVLAQPPVNGAVPSASPNGGSADSGVTANGARPASAMSAGSAAAQTPDERRAALDKRLNESLGAFDAKLHKEQLAIAEERDARQTTVSSASAGGSGAAGSSTSAGSPAAAGTHNDAGASTAAGGSAAATSSADGSGSSARTGADGSSATEVPGSHRGRRGETRDSRAGDLKSDKDSAGPTSASGNGAPATIIPDGNDDDIVARRLRKAAELETDPELKDKLWKEYVEYKKNTQVR